jgi:hypothetical protein
MMEIIANTDERQETTDRAKRSADLERHEGGHWRVQRDLDPATIYARYASARARRSWAIAIIALLSGLSWLALILLVIAVLSSGMPILW